MGPDVRYFSAFCCSPDNKSLAHTTHDISLPSLILSAVPHPTFGRPNLVSTTWRH
jgi:hypothetical protein